MAIVEWLGRFIYLIEAIFVVFMPCLAWYFGYRMGWRDAKEQTFKMTRAHHQNRLRY